MEYQFISNQINEGISTIYLNRPPFNPLNKQLFYELNTLIGELENNSEVKVIIITGSGDRSFCAGADLKEIQSLSYNEMLEMCEISHETLFKIESIGKPVIAAINGLALGGGSEVAIACDFRICTERSKFGFPEINLGLIPGAGGTQRLQRLIGQARAKEMVFSGEVIDAQQALSVGLVNKVVPVGSFDEEVTSFAKKLAEKPQVAMRYLKKSVNNGANVDLQTACKLEISYFANVFGSEDCKEGMQAFVEKRTPIYTGR